MGLFKKYPLFTSFVAVFALLFVAGLVFIFLSFTDVGKAKKSFANAQRSYKNALSLSPAPTKENVETSTKNVQALAAALQAQIDDTKGRAPEFVSKDAPDTEAEMLFQLQALKQQFTRDAAEVQPWGVEEAKAEEGIQLPEDFNFSFSRFLASGTPPPAKFIPAIFEQKEVLSYILRKLYDSQPVSIVSIQRETKVEKVAADDTQNNNRPNNRRGASDSDAGKDEFQVGDISARVPGAVETLGFRFVFTGYTHSLRAFLKSLEEFELPLVVRSVEVQPVEKKQATARSSRRAESNNPFALLNAGGGQQGGNAEQAQPAVSQEPVVDENLSQFTVVVEFIKVLVKAPTDVVALEADTSSTQNPM